MQAKEARLPLAGDHCTTPYVRMTIDLCIGVCIHSTGAK